MLKGTSEISQRTPTPSYILTLEAQRGDVIGSESKAEWGTGQKWSLLMSFPHFVFRVVFNFRLRSHSVFNLGVVTCDLPSMHSDHPSQDVCFGHIFSRAVMDWHWVHCNPLSVTSVEQDHASGKVCPWIRTPCVLSVFSLHHPGYSTFSTCYLASSLWIFFADILNSKITASLESCFTTVNHSLNSGSLFEHQYVKKNQNVFCLGIIVLIICCKFFMSQGNLLEFSLYCTNLC